MKTLPLRQDFSAERFAGFGQVIAGAAVPGARQFYSAALGSAHPAAAPVLHTNRVSAAALPFTLTLMERHPHAAQAFVPLDVARYLVVVAPGDTAAPQMDQAQAWIVPGHLGVIYGAGIWHAPARVLDRDASFAVLMWRGTPEDDQILPIAPVALLGVAQP